MDEIKKDPFPESTIVVTGATGTFGNRLIRRLMEHQDIRLIVFTRAESNEAARRRVVETLPDSPKITVYAADLTFPHLGLDDTTYDTITKNATHILHAAASTRFNQSIEEARKCNVYTTRHMLEFARACAHLKRFMHISTALVAGRRSGVILESEFEHDAGFLNTYQQSKYEAEALAREYGKELPVVILRPPLLISPFKKNTKPTNALTLSIFLARRGFLPFLPGTPRSSFDIMDGAIVADIMVRLLLKDSLSYDTYHVTSGKKTLTIGEIVEYLEKHLGDKKIPFAFTGTMDAFQQAVQKVTARNPALHLVYAKTKTFLPELAYPKVYDNQRILEELGLVDINHNAHDALKSILS